MVSMAEGEVGNNSNSNNQTKDIKNQATNPQSKSFILSNQIIGQAFNTLENNSELTNNRQTNSR